MTPYRESVNLTPQLCKELLDNDQTVNRRWQPPDTEMWARIMAAGGWDSLIGEPYLLSPPRRDNGKREVWNGLHRMQAAIQANFTIMDANVVWNATEEQRRQVDSGRKRSLGDALHMTGLKDVNLLSGIVRFVNEWRKGTISSRMSRFTNDELFREVMGDTRLWRGAVLEARRARERLPSVTPAVMGGFWVRITEVDPTFGQRFCNEVVEPPWEQPGNPAVVLHKLLHRKGRRSAGERLQKPSRIELLYYLTHAWDYYRKGEQILVDKIQLPGRSVLMRDIKEPKGRQ